jgi:CheY-like chemotaxis protein
MNVLLVEDDEFKATDIIKVLGDVLEVTGVKRAMSVTSSLRMVTRESFDVIVLDMSLPTFDLSGPGGGGSPQGQGGLEVLRLIRRLAAKPTVIVVTQYPDIEIDGKDTPLKAAPKMLREKFEINVLDCLMYEFDGDAWRAPLKEALGRLHARYLARNES